MTPPERRAGDLLERMHGPLARPSDLLMHDQELRAYFIELAKGAGQREEQVRMARAVLGLLAHREEVLPLETARGLISPVLRWLELAGLIEAVRPELELLADRHPRIVAGLVTRPLHEPDPLPPPGSARQEGDDLEALWLLSGDGDDEWRGEPGEREHLIQRWIELRPSVRDVAVRARADSRLLRFAIERRRRLPVEFAEALYDDERVWSAHAMVDIAIEQRRPLAREIGLSAGALVNARMAAHNPGIFLSEPEAPMITSADDAAELLALRSAQTGQLGEYLLGVTHELDVMLSRRGVIARASVESLRRSAQNTFALLGVRPWLPVGVAVTYDITSHSAVARMPDGSAARVVRTGLVRSADQAVLVKPVVEPIEPNVAPHGTSDAAVSSSAGREAPR